MLAQPPRSSGVYQIRCLHTGKVYIGSTVDFSKRWGQHRRSLRRGSHPNARLLRAWKKYGEENFEFTILEIVDVPDLLRAEQLWLEKTRCADRRRGFNIFGTAGSPGDSLARVWKGFVNPQGEEVTITNLYGFCRQHGIDFPSMHKLASGKSKLKSYKGWTHRNSPRRREYVKTYEGFVAPDAQLAGTITNLAAFCRKYGLDKTHMVAVAHGRIYSHRGWAYRNNRHRLNGPKTYQGFVNPEGQLVTINNLKTFCQNNDLSYIHMHNIKSGKRKSHKGWTWMESNEHK
ncbi:MAG: GIY-YIG nuclease family protein [Pyrinomonadaceae bacterium]